MIKFPSAKSSKSYREKFKIEFSSLELEVIEMALEDFRDKVGPESKPKVTKIIDKLYSEAYN